MCQSLRLLKIAAAGRGRIGTAIVYGLPRVVLSDPKVKIALVHDWLITWRGGEKVLEALLELMPNADLFTLFHEPQGMPASIERRTVHTAFIDKVPGARRVHRELLPLLPLAVRTLPLHGYDLVVHSEPLRREGGAQPGRAAPGLRARSAALHVGSLRRLLR